MSFRQTFRRSKLLWALFCAFLGVVAFCVCNFKILEMHGSSMEPILKGRQSPKADKHGDLVLMFRWVQHPLRTGDMVVVKLPIPGAGQVTTVRRIAAIPEAAATGSDTFKAYYVKAESTNGIDSAQVGLVPFSSVAGKVVKIIRVR